MNMHYGIYGGQYVPETLTDKESMAGSTCPKR